MAIRTFRPVTPGLRHRVQVINTEISSNKSKPAKSLTKGKSSTGGRASNGRISVRHHGGGHKRKYRSIDFKRDKFGVPGKVQSIEYDPNRSANIALIAYRRREALYSQPQGSSGWTDCVVGSRSRARGRQRVAPRKDSRRLHGAQCRAHPRARRPTRALRRRQRAHSCPGRRLCCAQAAFWRAADGIQEMHCDRRTGWQ